MKFDELTITDVVQEEKTEERIHINFSIRNSAYALVLLNEDTGAFQPARVYHRLNEKCPLCKKHAQFSICEWFFPHLTSVFHTIIELPSVRLKWLYIEHV